MLNNKRISRIIVSMFAAALSFTILAGCGSVDSNSVTCLSMEQNYPGGYDSQYFIRRISDKEGYPYTAISRFNVNTQEDEVIFQVENAASDRIKWLYAGRDNVFFVLSQPKSSPKYSLNLIDIDNVTCQKIYESDEELILASLDGEEYLYEGNTKYRLDVMYGELEQVPMTEGDLQVRNVYDEKTEIRYKMTSGEQVVIETTFGDPAITCTVDGKKFALDSISTDEYKNAAMSSAYMYDRDGVLYGALVIPKKQRKEEDMKVSPSLMVMSDVEKEVLFALDTKTGENKIVYEGNSGRIIGFNEHYAYLLDGRKVKRLFIEKNELATLGEISSYDHTVNLVARWTDYCLVMYDLDTGEVLGCLR